MKLVPVQLTEKTCQQLRIMGRNDQQYNEIISEILDHTKSCGRYWETKK